MDKMDKTVKTSIRIPEGVWVAAKVLAAVERKPLAQVISETLEARVRYLMPTVLPEPAEKKTARARKAKAKTGSDWSKAKTGVPIRGKAYLAVPNSKGGKK